jgi:hypothetical protein
MYQQRAEPEPEAFVPVGPWQPSRRFADEHEEPLQARGDEVYVVIDEIIADRARLVVSAWPSIDAGGRLHFTDAEVLPKVFRLASLEKTLNTYRRRARQTERNLRVGDVFFVETFHPTAPSRWRGVVDVTSAARGVTKAAFLRAVVQIPGLELVESFAEAAPPSEQPELPPTLVEAPKGSTANPTV